MKNKISIAIVGAMEQEIELLKALMHNCEEETIADIKTYHGKLFNHNVVLALCGIGKVNAAVATSVVLMRYKPEYVINTGSAGGLSKNLKVGDVVVAALVAHHDVDVTAFGYQLGQVPKMRPAFVCDEKLVNLAEKAASAFEGASVYKGLIVSGDQFINCSEKVAHIREHFFGACVVEMEAAAIAQTCAKFNVPFVVVRAVSDLADEEAEISFDEFLDTAALQSTRMVKQIISAL